MQAAQAKAQQEAELKQAASQQLASREAELISQHTRALHDAMARAADELHASQEASAAELEAARAEIRRLVSLLGAGSDEASALREALARAAEETAAVRKAVTVAPQRMACGTRPSASSGRIGRTRTRVPSCNWMSVSNSCGYGKIAIGTAVAGSPIRMRASSAITPAAFARNGLMSSSTISR